MYYDTDTEYQLLFLEIAPEKTKSKKIESRNNKQLKRNHYYENYVSILWWQSYYKNVLVWFQIEREMTEWQKFRWTYKITASIRMYGEILNLFYLINKIKMNNFSSNVCRLFWNKKKVKYFMNFCFAYLDPWHVHFLHGVHLLFDLVV